MSILSIVLLILKIIAALGIIIIGFFVVVGVSSTIAAFFAVAKDSYSKPVKKSKPELPSYMLRQRRRDAEKNNDGGIEEKTTDIWAIPLFLRKKKK